MRGDAVAAVPNRGLITFSIMLANIMQGVDNTTLNVALPHIQSSLSASLDQVAWVRRNSPNYIAAPLPWMWLSSLVLLAVRRPAVPSWRSSSGTCST